MLSSFAPYNDWLERVLARDDLPLAGSTEQFSWHIPVEGVLFIEPLVPESSRSVVLSAGIHGNETAQIEVLNHLVTDLFASRIVPETRILIILGNIDAMLVAERFIDINMNRLFNGQHRKADQSLPEVIRAASLEQQVDEFFKNAPSSDNWHLDLHTAIRGSYRERFAIHPYAPGLEVLDESLNILASASINTLLCMENSGSTFSSHSGLHWQAQSFTVELGQVAPFGENDLVCFQDVYQMLVNLISGESATGSAADVEQFRVVHEITHPGKGFELNLSEDGYNFTRFEKGDWVYKTPDTAYQVGGEAQYIVFPNTRVAAGQRAGLLLEKLTR